MWLKVPALPYELLRFVQITAHLVVSHSDFDEWGTCVSLRATFAKQSPLLQRGD